MHPHPPAGHAGLPTFDVLESAVIESLNRDCFCISLDRDALRHEVDAGLDSAELSAMLQERCPHMFSALPVFVSSRHAAMMEAVIAAAESVVHLPAFQERLLAVAPEAARVDPGADSVFFGYDFHLGAEGPKLIEINTNAGGALLNTVLAKAQRACCAAVEGLLAGSAQPAGLAQAIFDMFAEEWRLGGHRSPLQRVAIVDNDPPAQYLYPEFLLFQRLFRQHGVDALVASPEELDFIDGELRHRGQRIDLVYNRLTDFYFEQPGSAALRQAWFARSAVITPHPRAHALYADKRNLAILSSRDALVELGVAEKAVEVLLAGIPRTEIVMASDADDLWSRRRKLFFKPASGFGSKAAYRGDKLTRRVWEEILAGDYVAQELVAPGERHTGGGDAGALKVDLRNYVYQGQVQLVAARLYQGQTTNFRTAGGGFAPVFIPGRKTTQAEARCC